MSKDTFRYGYLTVRKQSRKGKEVWQADWWAGGRRHRQNLRVVDRADLDRQVAMLNELVITDMLQPANATPKDTLTVEAALDRAIEASNGRDRTKWQFKWHAKDFLAWLARERPEVRLWSELKTETIRAYLAHLRDRRIGNKKDRPLARNSLRLYLCPLKMASRFWAQNDPDRYRDVAACAKLPPDYSDPLERAEREQAKALSPADLDSLLCFLRMRRPALWGPAMLMGLCGLRMLEALAIRECDVNFEQGTIRITKTGDHTPKTRFSYRRIPVPQEALAMLRETIKTLPIGDETRPVFLTFYGKPWIDHGHDDFSYALTKALRACWQALGIESLRNFQPHWLRATFASGVRSQGCDPRVVQVYMGHSRGDVLGLHYEQIDMDRLRSVIIPAIENWRKNCHNSPKSTPQEASQTGLSPVLAMAGEGGFEPPTF